MAGLSRRRRARIRYLEPDRLKAHERGVRRLDEAFGVEHQASAMSAVRKASILERLGFNKKATDE